MIYICEGCSFLFYRAGEVYECPFCEQYHIRIATDEEVGKYASELRNRQYVGIRSEGRTRE